MQLRAIVCAPILLASALSVFAVAQVPSPPPASAAGACTIVGPVLGPSDFGVPAGQPVADASAVRLADGRVRLYVFAQGRGIVSAVSLTPAGVAFAAEPGVRLPDGSGMPRAVALPDLRIRLFYTNAGGIKSAISADGINFTDEPEFRITALDAGFGMTGAQATSGASVIPLADGRFRMYFSDLPRPGDPPGGHLVKTAVSMDQLAWTVEPGVRLGTGAAVLTESAEHPFALTNPNGSVTLYYGKFGNVGSANAEGVYQATSLDGLTFDQETLAVVSGNDPDALRLIDGSLMLYYGQFDPVVGGTINAARCPDPSASVPAPPAGTPTLTVTIVGTAGSGSFTPNPLPATIGDSVVFTNQDSRTHHLVLDNAASTEIGTLVPGQSSVPISMTSAGVTYHCTIHPSMVGTLGAVDGPPTPTPVPPPSEPPQYDGYRRRNLVK